MQAGLQSTEEYLEVALARIDAVRWQGSEHMPDLRAAFQAANDMMQVGARIVAHTYIQTIICLSKASLSTHAALSAHQDACRKGSQCVHINCLSVNWDPLGSALTVSCSVFIHASIAVKQAYCHYKAGTCS